MDEKAEFAKRLKQAMVKAGYDTRPATLEKQFNSRYMGRSVSFQAASRWLLGRSIPSQEKLQVLAEWLKVEPQVLRYGEPAIRRIRDRKQQWDQSVSHVERETFEAFLALPTAQKKVIRDVIFTFAKAFPPAGNNQL